MTRFGGSSLGAPLNAAGRKVTDVAVGVLQREDGSVLLADRPAGKAYAGYWEFPGGKIEADETVTEALARELHEELDIEIGRSQPWVTFEFDYPHAYVRLHFRRIRHWRGSPRAREGQRFAFVRPDAPPQPLLPAAVPALRWLQLPARAAVAADPAQALQWLQRQRAPSVLIVPREDDGRLRAALRECGGLLLTGRALGQADGLILDQTQLAAATVRPQGQWVAAWIASQADLRRAAQLGCDFALCAKAIAPAEATPLPLFVPAGAADEGEAESTCGTHGTVEILGAGAAARQ